MDEGPRTTRPVILLHGNPTWGYLALLAIAALRSRVGAAIPLVWLFVAATALDLVNGSIGGMREGALGSAVGVTWLILAFYVPVLYTSVGLIAWQLVWRRHESLR